MPFARPTLSEIRADVAADISSNLGSADALLRFSNLFILGIAEAGQSHEHYGYLDWIAKQSNPFTATGEFLEAWAGLKGVVRKNGTFARLTVAFTNCVALTDVPNATPLVRSDGVAYTTTSDEAVSGGGTVTLPVTANVAGAPGNMINGQQLTLGTAIAGMQSTGTIASVVAAGVDPESDDSLRSRMLQVYAAPPQGGDKTDYIEWAERVPGVTRAWCVPNGVGVGTVVVYFMMDVTESAHNGFPQGTDGVAAAETRSAPATGDQLIVANYLYPLQPVTALVFATSPIQNVVNFTIDQISGVSAAVKTAIAAAISGVFVTVASPGSIIDLSDIEAAIAAVPGTEGFVITSPAGNIAQTAGQLPVLGIVTYT